MTTFTTEDRFAVLAEKAKEHLLSIEQGTDDWHQLRLGKVTASRMADVLSKGKSGESASRKNYRTELVVQRITGTPSESFTNAAMEWGTKTEPLARVAYEVAKGCFVEQVAFVDHPTIKYFGCSPDGLVGEGLIEIKCGNTTTHVDWMLDNKVPNKHIPQMMAQMAVTGSRWCDFVSYDPRVPDDLQLFVIRLERDEKYIEKMEKEVRLFLQEVDNLYKQLLTKKGVK